YLRIVGWSLAADANMAAVAPRSADSKPQHLQHPRIAFIEIEGDYLRVAIYPESQLSEIVRANREAVEQGCKRINLDDIVGYLAHYIYLKPVFSLLKSLFRHRDYDLSRLLDAATERYHHIQVG